MQLSAQQTAAVTTQAKRVLICAPAGSGKTTTMVERILHLMIQRGVPASQILALTFTRYAANNIRVKLRERLGADADAVLRDITIGTVHSVALRILQTYGDALGYAPTKLTVIEPYEADMLLERVAESLGYWRKGVWRNNVTGARAAAFVSAHDGGANENELKEMGGRAALAIVREYNTRMYSMNTITFGRILTECRRLFTKRPDVLAKYQERWGFINVDEAQDSSAVQFSLFEALSPPSELFMVGDLRQSIYGWANARPEILRGMIASGSLAVIDLEQSFRCPSAVADVANRLIEHDGGFTGKPMIAANGRTGSVTVFNGRSADIAGKVKAQIEGGYRPGEIAILGRNHRTLKRLAAVLQEAGIPSHRVGGGFDIEETDAFREVRAMLRLAVNPKDALAAMTLANDSSMAKAIAGMPRESLMGDIAEYLGEPENSHKAAWQWWARRCGEMTVADALEWYTCHRFKVDPQEDIGDRQAVTLSTVHAFKGLEAPCVFVVGMNDGDFPSGKSLAKPERIKEERRVGYVAFTRASESLHIHYREPQDQSERGKIKRPSMFLGEAGLQREAVPA